MSRLHHVENMIAQLGAQMGLPGLAPDDSGRFSLTVGDAPVTFLYAAHPVELIWIYCGLGELSDGDEAAMAYLLRATGRVWNGSGTTIGLGEDGKRLLSCLQIPVVSLDTEGLKEALTVLLEASLPVRAALAAGDYGDPDAGSAPTSVSGPPPSPPAGGFIRP